VMDKLTSLFRKKNKQAPYGVLGSEDIDQADDLIHSDDEDGAFDNLSANFDHAVEQMGVGMFHVMAIGILGIANASDAIELLAISYILPLVPNVHDYQEGIISASVFAGMLVGGVLCGFFSDKFGRKPCLVASVTINAIFGVASAFAPNWPVLCVFRVFSGVGIGGSIPSVFTLAVELLPVKNRGRYIIAVAWFWMVGSIFAAGLAWVMLGVFDISWRWYAGFVATPAATCAILSLFFLPESPRYLFIKGRLKETVRVLNYISSVNRRPCPVSKTSDLIPSLSVNHSVEDLKKRLKEDNKSDPFWMLFHPKILRVTVLMCVIWWSLSFGWYGLILWIPELFDKSGFDVNVYESAFLVSASNLPGNIVSLILVEIIGRKYLLAMDMGASAVLAVGFAFSDSKWAIVPIAMCFNGISIGGWNALDCSSTELVPTSLRTTAMGLFAAFGRMGSLIAQLVNGALIDVSTVALLCTASGTMLLGCVATLLLPKEVKNQKLSDKLTT